MLTYREQIPIGPVRAVVLRFWMMRSAGLAEPERIVPDGCPELIFNLADPFDRIRDHGKHRQAGTLLVGQLPSAIRIASTGRVDLFGIRFEPHGLASLTGIAAHTVTDLDLDASDVDRPLAFALRDAVASGAFAERCLRASGVLDSAMSRRPTDPGAWLAREAVDAAERGDTLSIDQIAHRIGANRRTVERAFRSHVGLTPKRFLRIARIRRVIADLERGGVSLSGLAARHGFADQPHLTREFGQLAGVTPGAYLAERTPFDACLVGADAN
ncbi:MAG: helix-turn-helix transcriptional regulator [Planctomycetota bacterium]